MAKRDELLYTVLSTYRCDDHDEIYIYVHIYVPIKTHALASRAARSELRT